LKTNQILAGIITPLKLSTEEILEIYNLAEFSITESRLVALLHTEGERDFKQCSFEELGTFLDGLILFRRGPSPKKAKEDAVIPLTNNLILKKLRIALELKEPETEIIFSLGEVELSKQELKSLFRKEDHKNFRSCSDELLMAFLEGLDEYYYDGSKD
jgi:uncharacterized protein YehS (DUF1456 family)